MAHRLSPAQAVEGEKELLVGLCVQHVKLAALAALSIMSTMISLFAITRCSGSTPRETIYASLARAGAFVHFFAVLWWRTLVMLALASVAAWLRSGLARRRVAHGRHLRCVPRAAARVLHVGQRRLPAHLAALGRRSARRCSTSLETGGGRDAGARGPWSPTPSRGSATSPVRVATEEPKAEDTDDESGDAAWEEKKATDDGALDHIVDVRPQGRRAEPATAPCATCC